MPGVVCPQCKYTNEPQMRYCIQCGTLLARVCLQCGYANPSNAHFCGMCGFSLNAGFTTHAAPYAGNGNAARFVEPERKEEQLLLATPPSVRSADGSETLIPRELTGERRMATVLIADVHGSTQLMEKIGTEAWVGVMNHIFQVLEAEIYRMGGEIDQYRGDGVLAFFGARSVHEDDPERAVLAGLLIQRSFQFYARQVQQEHPEIELKLRVGINTGEVIVTSIGQQHYEHTAMGGAVALASRMETSAEPGTVLVTQFTHQQTADRFEYQPLGQIEVKGIAEPVTVYRPLRPKNAENRAFTQAVALVGRKTQSAQLTRSIEELPTGHGAIVMINGDKGMGKSFLVNHVWQEVKRKWLIAHPAVTDPDEYGESVHPVSAQVEPVQWIGGQCRSYGQSWPYSMWFDLINYWLRSLTSEQEPAALQSVFNAAVQSLWGEESAQFAPFLAHLLDLPLDEALERRLQNLDAQTYQDRFFDAVSSWLRHLTLQKPLIVSFYNLQWADASSIELLKHCLPLSDTHSILFLITMRPVRNAPSWPFRHYLGTEFPHRLVWIDMLPLSETETTEFVNLFLGNNELTAEDQHMLFRRSEGNPYYLREILNYMIDRGVLKLNTETNSWSLIPGKEMFDLPNSLQGILQEYIANLSGDERHVLQVASVIGARFWDKLLARMLDMNMEILRVHLTTLQRLQLIRERYQEDEYRGMMFTFNSNLMRDAAYESMLKPQRAAYHLRCAELVEAWIAAQDRQVPNLSQVYGYLAQHYELAGNFKNQMQYHILAAESAEKMHANEEALFHLDRAIEIASDLASAAETAEEHRELVQTQFEIYSSRRWLRLMLADIRGSQQDAEFVLALTEHELSDDPIARIDAILMYTYPSAYSLFTAEESKRMSDITEEALYLARTINDPQREMETLAKITFLRSNSNDANVHEPAMQALQIARELGDVNMQFNLLLNYGYYLLGRDQNDEGMRYINEALHLSEAIDDPFSKMSVLSVLGPRFERNGDYYRWLTEYEEKRLEISRKIGSRMAEGNSLMYCGMIRAIYLGDLSGGLELLEESKRLLENAPTRLFVILRIAQTYHEMGEYALAQAALDEAEPLTREYVLELARVGYKLLQIMVNNEQDDLEHLKTALQLAEEIDQLGRSESISQQYRMAAASHASSVHRKVAVALSAQKNLDDIGREKRAYHLAQSVEKARLALQIYEEFGYTNASEITGEWILYRMGQALIANGQREEALPYIRRAFDEMMRKHDLIPAESGYRQRFLENIVHHRQIQSAYRLLTF